MKEHVTTSAKGSLGLHELKRRKSRCDEVMFKMAKMAWLQDPNDSNVVNLNNVRHEASRHCMKKEKEYLKAKTDELETNSKLKKNQRLVQGHR